VVPWWKDECKRVVKERNKALKILKSLHNFKNVIQYKRAQARVRGTIRRAKMESWWIYCRSGVLTLFQHASYL